MSKKAPENKDYGKELVSDEVLKNKTVLSYKEVVEEYVDSQIDIAELIDPEAGQEERKRYVDLIKDDVFLDSLTAIARMGLDSDNSGVVDGEDIDDTLLSLEATSPSLLDLFIGQAYAATISEEKVEKAQEAFESIRIELSNNGEVDYEKAQRYASALFEMDELNEEEQPIVSAFATSLVLTLRDYYYANKNTDEVFRALGNLAEIVYGWPLVQKYDEKQLESYPEEKHARSDSVVLAGFFVDVMFKSMEGAGENKEAFIAYFEKVWEIFGFGQDERLMETFAWTLNIGGARKERFEEARSAAFGVAKNQVIDGMAGNDLAYDKERTKVALGKCRASLSSEDQQVFERIFVRGEFNQSSFEHLKTMEMSVSIKEILGNRILDAVSSQIGGAAGAVLDSGLSESKRVSDLFDELGLTPEHLALSYSTQKIGEKTGDNDYGLNHFTATDVAEYFWSHKGEREAVQREYREYAEKVQADIDAAREVENSDQYENFVNILSAVGLMLSDNMATESVPLKAFAIIGGGTVALHDYFSLQERIATVGENGLDGFGHLGANILDYALHNTNLLPYMTWINGSKTMFGAQFVRGVVSPVFGNITTTMKVPTVTGAVGLKILIADVILDIRIDDATGKISFGLPGIGGFEQHSRNWNEDAKELFVSLIYLIIAARGADSIQDFASVKGWLDTVKNIGFKDKFVSELGLDHEKYKSKKDKIKPTDKQLSLEDAKKSIDGIAPIEELPSPIEYQRKAFTHRSIIMQSVEYNGADAKRVIIRLFNESTGDYIDMQYVVDENGKRLKSTIGDVKNVKNMGDRVGRLKRGKSPLGDGLLHDYRERYKGLRKELTQNGELPDKGHVDIPGLENKAVITSEPIVEKSASGWTRTESKKGVRYVIERTSTSRNYTLYIDHMNDGAIKITMSENGVFKFQQRAVAGNFLPIEELKTIDFRSPHQRQAELGLLDSGMFEDPNSLFLKELDAFVDKASSHNGPIDGNVDLHFRPDEASEHLKDQRRKQTVKAVLEGFGEGHELSSIADLDVGQLKIEYTSMGEVVIEVEPRSFNGEMFNKRVIIVRSLEGGKTEVTVRLFQDRSALKSGGVWDKTKIWAQEKYCDVKYTVQNGESGDPKISKWKPVKDLGRGNASTWLADYAEVRSLVEPSYSYAEEVVALESNRIYGSPEDMIYAKEIEVDGAKKYFEIQKTSDATGKTVVEIRVDGEVVYQNAELKGGPMKSLLDKFMVGDKCIVDGGLYLDDGMPIALTDPEAIEVDSAFRELDDLIKNARSRTSGAVRALDSLTPAQIERGSITSEYNRMGPRQQSNPHMLEQRLGSTQPKVTGIVELAHPLKMDGGVFTHVASMSFENVEVLMDGQVRTLQHLEQDIFFDPKKNLVRQSFRFGSIERVRVESTVTRVDNVRTFMEGYDHLVEHIGEDPEMRGYLDDSVQYWEDGVNSGRTKTTVAEWVKMRTEPARRVGGKVWEILREIHLDDRGQCDPVKLVKGIIDFFVRRPADALYGPDTPAGRFIEQLRSDPEYRARFFREMKVKVTEGVTPKMNALEGLGAIMMVVFAISVAHQRQNAGNADEAGKKAAPTMVGFGVGMGAGIVAESITASLSWVKAAPGIWGKAIAFATGFVAGMSAGMWSHHALGVPLEKRHPMFAHYVGTGGEILFSGGGVTDLLMMSVTNSTEDIYVWMNESVPGFTLNLKDPEKRWLDIENFRWHAGVHKDWTLAWNKEIDGAIRGHQLVIDNHKRELSGKGTLKSSYMQAYGKENGERMWKDIAHGLEIEIGRREEKIAGLEAKKIVDEGAWRDDQLVELLNGKDMLDEQRHLSKAHLRIATSPSRAKACIRELGSEHLPKELYDKIVQFEDEIIPSAMRDPDMLEIDAEGNRPLDLLHEKLRGYRLMATAMLVPHVNAIEFYKGGFGDSQLYGREKEEVERFDADALVDAEAIFLEQPADEPFFSREKGLEGSIMGTPGAETLQEIADALAKDGDIGLSQSVAEYIMMQDTLATRAVTLEAYELLPPNWEQKAEELRQEKFKKELPEELQMLIAMLEDIDKAVEMTEEMDGEL